MLNSKEQAMWGIHGGQTGDADTLFLKQNMIALGWDGIGDLSALPDREAFKAQVAKVYPHDKPAAVRNNARQLFRFVQEMQIDYFVIYPSKRDKQIHIKNSCTETERTSVCGIRRLSARDDGIPYKRIS